MGRAVKSYLVAIPMVIVMSATALADSPAGLWILESGKASVRISPCPQGFCGRLAGLTKPLYKLGKPKLDKHNPDPALRKRRLVGITLFRGLRATRANEWQARVYLPFDGRIYEAVLKLDGSTMRVQGCVGPFCRSKRFFRAGTKSKKR